MAINKTTASRIPKFVPFQEAVTYYARTSGDSFTSYSVTRAHRKKIDLKDGSFAPEILVTADLIWSICADYLSVTPKQDDYLTDSSGTKWVVLSQVQQFNGRIFNLLCRRGV